MAAGKINILLSLKDQFSSAMGNVVNSATDAVPAFAKAKEAVSSIKEGFAEVVDEHPALKAALTVVKGAAGVAKTAFEGFGSFLKGSFTLALEGVKAVAGKVWDFISSTFSLDNIKQFTSECIELAQDQIEAETKLEAVLGNIPSLAAGGTEAIAAAKDELMGVASDIQSVGVIGDEVTLAGMQQLATFQLSTEEIAQLSTGMTDLLAQQKGLNATQEDAVSIANLIGKAMTGQTSALSKTGIIMTDAQEAAMKEGDSIQRAATLAEILQMNVGGVNEALAETDQGAIQQVTNCWGDMKEEVGKVALEIKGKFAKSFSSILPNIQDLLVGIADDVSGALDPVFAFLEEHGAEIGTVFSTITSTIGSAFSFIASTVSSVLGPALNTVFSALQKNGSNITGLFDTIKGAVNKLIPVFSTIFASIAPIVQKVVSVVSTAISALVPVIVPIITDIGEKISGFVDAVSPVIERLLDVIQSVIPVIGSVISTAWGVISPIINLVLTLLPKVLSVVTSVFEGIQSIISRVWGVIQPIIEAIGNKLSSFASTVSGALSSFGGLFGGGGSDSNATGTSYYKGGLTTVSEGGRAETVILPEHMPHYATGTSYSQSGPANVSEGGRAETLILPSGTQILSHDQSKAAQGATNKITVNLTVQGNVIGNRQFMEQTGDYIYKQIRNALAVV